MTPCSLALAACLGLVLSSCDSNSEHEIGGTYSGVTEQLGDRTTFLALVIPGTQDGETFRFTGTVTEQDYDAISRESTSGSGTYDHPTITLVVLGETLEGTVSDDGDDLRLEVEDNAFATLSRD